MIHKLKNQTLARQYMFISFFVMLAGMLIIGAWVSNQIEERVTSRTAAVTALYVDSYISPYLQELAEQPNLNENNIAFFERLLSDTLLGREILSFKIWTPDGTIVYSPNPELIGQQYPVEEGLALALDGEVYSEISGLDRSEQVAERAISDELIETYAPVRTAGGGEIIAVSEFYQSATALQMEIRSAQYRSWLVVALVSLAVYLLLAQIVQRASQTIVSQQTTLEQNVARLQELLSQNKALHERVRRASGRITALNERYLRGISADLHDGPAQDLALALLRLESLAEPCLAASANGSANSSPNGSAEKAQIQTDFETVRLAVDSALEELRMISAGLRLPELEPISVQETVRRAVKDYEQKTQEKVAVGLQGLPDNAPLPVKITLYRVVREALTNSYQHTVDRAQAVSVQVEGTWLSVRVSDSGEGFDPDDTLITRGRLGLVSMAERVESLGGRFGIESRPGQGTTIHATLPLNISEVNDV